MELGICPRSGVPFEEHKERSLVLIPVAALRCIRVAREGKVHVQGPVAKEALCVRLVLGPVGCAHVKVRNEAQAALGDELKEVFHLAKGCKVRADRVWWAVVVDVPDKEGSAGFLVGCARVVAVNRRGRLAR